MVLLLHDVISCIIFPSSGSVLLTKKKTWDSKHISTLKNCGNKQKHAHYIYSREDYTIFFGSLHFCKSVRFFLSSNYNSSSGVSFEMKVCGSVFYGRNVFVLI